MSSKLILKLMIGAMLASTVQSCSKAPKRYATGRGGADSENGGNGGGGGGNNTTSGGSEVLKLNYVRLTPAAFRSLLNKLSYVAGVESKNTLSYPALSELIKNRSNLGDYDYSIRKPSNDLWQSDQMKLWLQSLLPYCQDASLQKKYDQDLAKFVPALLGRKLNSDELSDIKANAQLSADKKSSFEAGCLAFTSSLEFRNQWPTAESTLKDYLNLVASTVVERPLLESELDSSKLPEDLLKSWTESDRFVEASRQYVERLLKASGKIDDLDMDLPGYLFTYIVKNHEPFSKLITSPTCYDKAGKEMSCDTGAPYTSGVFTTRAFMKNTAGAYNIARSNFLLGTFSCLTYPMSGTVEPLAPRETLIPTFAATEGKSFGNGTNCYSCHSQFSKHAQLFVKYDFKGLYNAKSTGLQVEGGGDGHSKDGTFVSHFSASTQAASEKTEYFGEAVTNLADAAKVIAHHDTFIPCTVKRVLQHFLRIQPDEVATLPTGILKDIEKEIRAESADPSFQTIVTKALSNEKLIQAYLANKGTGNEEK